MKNIFVAGCVLLMFSHILCVGDSKQAVLVTGGAGYVGSHIALVLAQKGYEVFVIDNKIKKQFTWAHYIQADYADEQALTTLFTNHKIECVFHCAALCYSTAIIWQSCRIL